MKTEFGELKN